MAPKGNTSSSSQVVFGKNVVYSSKILSAPRNMLVGKNNFFANFSIPSNVSGFKDIVKFLSKHPISSAVTLSTEMYQTHLFEFWYRCDYRISASKKEIIIGTVLDGDFKIKITLRKLRNIMNLSFDENFKEPISVAEAKEEILPIIGYGFLTIDATWKPVKNTVVYSRMGRVWNYFFAHIIQCLSSKSRSFDQSTISDL